MLFSSNNYHSVTSYISFPSARIKNHLKLHHYCKNCITLSDKFTNVHTAYIVVFCFLSHVYGKMFWLFNSDRVAGPRALKTCKSHLNRHSHSAFYRNNIERLIFQFVSFSTSHVSLTTLVLNFHFLFVSI